MAQTLIKLITEDSEQIVGPRRTLGQYPGQSAEMSNDMRNSLPWLVVDAHPIEEPLARRNEGDARFRGTFETPPARHWNRHKPG